MVKFNCLGKWYIGSFTCIILINLLLQDFLRDVFHSCLFALPEDCCDERDLPLCKSKVSKFSEKKANFLVMF